MGLYPMTFSEIIHTLFLKKLLCFIKRWLRKRSPFYLWPNEFFKDSLQSML